MRRTISTFYLKPTKALPALIKSIAKKIPITDPSVIKSLCSAIVNSIANNGRQRQLFIDVSAIIETDLKTGIQRVVRAILSELLKTPHSEFRVEPIYATGDHSYRYARKFTLNFMGCPDYPLPDELIVYQAGDVFFALDWHPDFILKEADFLRNMRANGVVVNYMIYDLLPIHMPHHFPNITEIFTQWLAVISEGDQAICISKTVADEMNEWVKTYGQPRSRPLKISWAHLGADTEHSLPTSGLPVVAASVLTLLKQRPTFLMVSTVEARKGHTQVLAAFEFLWDQGIDVNFVIVGKQGWMVEALIKKISQHPELGRRLFWLNFN